jgi:acetyl esterase/lipase
MDFSHFGSPSKEWIAFVKENPNTIVPPVIAAGQHLDVLQATVNAEREQRATRELEGAGIADNVIVQDHDIPTRDGATITVRVYRPSSLPTEKLPAVVYYHGGGYVYGTLDGEKFFGCDISTSLSVVLIHVCTRHVPQVRHPTPHHDAWDGFEWILNNATDLSIDYNRIILTGASAGGGLASSVMTREIRAAQSEGRALRVKGQSLVVPWIIHRDAYPYHLFTEKTKASPVQCAEAPINAKVMYDLFTDELQAADVRDPLLNAALEDESILRAMPPTAVIASGWDVFRDDALLFATTIQRLG